MGASPGIGVGVVVIGSCVRVRDDDGERELTIVEPADADARSGRVSVESPLGHALMGHAAGDSVAVRAPAGGRAVSIVEVRQ
jgi:transcription elongation GreA/GreB family factor